MSEYNAFSRRVIAPFFRHRIKSVDGIEHIPQKRPFIFAVNHTVAFDHVILTSFLIQFIKKKVYFPTKKKYFDFYTRLKYADKLGMICVDPERPASCLNLLMEKIRKGHSIGIFPEGIGHGEKKLYRGKTGVARLAIWSRLPVVPIGVTGGVYKNEQIDWLRLFLDHRKNVNIRIGKSIHFDQHYSKPINYSLLRKITDHIMHEVSKLCEIPYEYYRKKTSEESS